MHIHITDQNIIHIQVQWSEFKQIAETLMANDETSEMGEYMALVDEHEHGISEEMKRLLP